jgi:hypothetical protein
MSDLARYQLVAPIPRSADSVTEAFRALDTTTGAEVTLEVVRSGATSVEKARFGTRARRLAGVEHPSLVAVVDVGPTHCALEAPSGTPLTEHARIAIARSRQKLSWLARIAGALAALHKGGIAHGRFGLDAVVLPMEGRELVKLSVPASGDMSGSPLEDLRAFGSAACQLVLGEDLAGQEERHIAERFVDAGLPLHAGTLIARACTGRIPSADLADELAPFADFSGPTTERLLPVSPRR